MARHRHTVVHQRHISEAAHHSAIIAQHNHTAAVAHHQQLQVTATRVVIVVVCVQSIVVKAAVVTSVAHSNSQAANDAVERECTDWPAIDRAEQVDAAHLVAACNCDDRCRASHLVHTQERHVN
jgi:hypothetical protein